MNGKYNEKMRTEDGGVVIAAGAFGHTNDGCTIGTYEIPGFAIRRTLNDLRAGARRVRIYPGFENESLMKITIYKAGPEYEVRKTLVRMKQ